MRTIVNMVIISTACASFGAEVRHRKDRSVNAAPANFPGGQLSANGRGDDAQGADNKSDDAYLWDRLLSELRNPGAGHEKIKPRRSSLGVYQRQRIPSRGPTK
jgi:hypothetical protein